VHDFCRSVLHRRAVATRSAGVGCERFIAWFHDVLATGKEYSNALPGLGYLGSIVSVTRSRAPLRAPTNV
jgi:hypothetical protein